LKVKGGIVTGQIVDDAGIEALSKLPSREELLATLIATIQAPAQKLVMLLQAPQRDLILIPVTCRIHKTRTFHT